MSLAVDSVTGVDVALAVAGPGARAFAFVLDFCFRSIIAIAWYVVAGLPGLVIFKVVSTMDSMVGYKTPRYLQFGWCGARLDDVREPEGELHQRREDLGSSFHWHPPLR